VYGDPFEILRGNGKVVLKMGSKTAGFAKFEWGRPRSEPRFSPKAAETEGENERSINTTLHTIIPYTNLHRSFEARDTTHLLPSNSSRAI